MIYFLSFITIINAFCVGYLMGSKSLTKFKGNVDRVKFKKLKKPKSVVLRPKTDVEKREEKNPEFYKNIKKFY